ncbi:YesL family protein [Sediminibacillus massiliensis]|uniref:YesL family protein n=1 Tax=Sediminibacillus massiliensis TaxID=1926277 RepID=UPI00098859A4|nr:DUF624 domain-containing protein [Sediminibacillus massiliensis]
MQQGWKSGLARFADWFSRMAYINLMWIGFTIMGLVVFGFIPATTAMFSVMRKWIKGDLDSSVLKTFWGYYRQEFIKSNLAGVGMLIIGYVLYVDLFLFELGSMPLIQIPVYILAVLYLLMCAFFFTIYVQFDLKWYQYMKMAFLMAFAAPFRAVSMLVSGYLVFFLMTKMSVVMIFFLGSFISYLWLMISLPTFSKLENPHSKGHQSKMDAKSSA